MQQRVEAGLCVSVAWDWQFEGVSCKGVAAETRLVQCCSLRAGANRLRQIWVWLVAALWLVSKPRSAVAET